MFARVMMLVAGLAMGMTTMAEEATPGTAYVPTVMVTGANRGIGLEFVRQYAERGARVIATARDPAGAQELNALAAANPRIIVERLDVTDFAQVDALAARYADQPIDVLINNAGISGGMQKQMYGRMDYAVFEEVLRVNTIAPLKVTEAFTPSVLASQQKRIVAISSSEGSVSMVDSSRLPFMRASKAALNMEMRNVAFQLKPKGASVRILNPGLVDTDFMKGLPKRMLRPTATVVGELIPLIDAMSVENTGSFLGYDGKELPW